MIRALVLLNIVILTTFKLCSQNTSEIYKQYSFSIDAGATYGMFYLPKDDFKSRFKGCFLRLNTPTNKRNSQIGYLELMFGATPKQESIWFLDAKLGIGMPLFISSSTQIPAYLSLGYGVVKYKDHSGGGFILGTKITPKFSLSERISFIFSGDIDLHFSDTLDNDDFNINTFYITGYLGLGISILFMTS
ncbi:MAG: hypothetical protein R2774_02100 [Saprospiraceae bacterium]